MDTLYILNNPTVIEPSAIPIYLIKLNAPKAAPFLLGNSDDKCVDIRAGMIPTISPIKNMLIDNI
ncbi:hypothetical protein [Staphylococcus succinus]|uniref:hypothetical protein n=1 Tax=Staphylococcus succinus TaxID=61015 RepID=UPI00115DBA83|nr:hypothetical protein [Staphylococcus succinus]